MKLTAETSETSATIGAETIVEPGVVVGYRYHPNAGPAVIGAHGILRMGTIIYGDVTAGDYFQTGHHTVIRAKVRAGNYCNVYNHTTLEGIIRLGDGVRIMSHVYIPSRTWIGDHVFIGPGVTFLNEKTPCRYDTLPTPQGATIENDVMIGGGCTIMAGVRIGEGSFIAAGAVVTKDIPPWSLAKGVPAKAEPLPNHLRQKNCRQLTIQPLDFWHPRVPAHKLPTWPAAWKMEST